MRKLLSWFLIFVIVQPKAWADAPVVLRAPQASIVDYQAWLATHPRLQTFSEWWIKNRVPKAQEMDLERKLELAQIEFLQGGTTKAKELFLMLGQTEHSQDWRADERKAFAYARLRLAQMAADMEEQEVQVKAAASWGPVNLKDSHFPPPIWKSYGSALKNVIQEQLDLDLWFPGVRFLLVDGRPYEALLTTELPVDSAKHRFTLVFDHAAPKTFVATWTEFKSWRPSIASLVTGSCEKFEIQSGAQSAPGAQVYFSNDCVAGTPQPQVPKAIAAAEMQPIGGDWHKPASVLPKSNSNTWLWAGLGVLALGSLALLSQKENEEAAAPTTTVGF